MYEMVGAVINKSEDEEEPLLGKENNREEEKTQVAIDIDWRSSLIIPKEIWSEVFKFLIANSHNNVGNYDQTGIETLFAMRQNNKQFLKIIDNFIRDQLSQEVNIINKQLRNTPLINFINNKKNKWQSILNENLEEIYNKEKADINESYETKRRAAENRRGNSKWWNPYAKPSTGSLTHKIFYWLAMSTPLLLVGYVGIESLILFNSDDYDFGDPVFNFLIEVCAGIDQLYQSTGMGESAASILSGISISFILLAVQIVTLFGIKGIFEMVNFLSDKLEAFLEEHELDIRYESQKKEYEFASEKLEKLTQSMQRYGLFQSDKLHSLNKVQADKQDVIIDIESGDRKYLGNESEEDEEASYQFHSIQPR